MVFRGLLDLAAAGVEEALDHEHGIDLDDGAATSRWTTVVTHRDELGWLRETL